MNEIFRNIPAGGTVFNALAVFIGSSLGLLIGKFIPEKMQATIFNCMGLFTLYVGINMTLGTKHSIAVLLSLVLGTITGEILGIEKKLNNLGDTLKKKFHAENSKFTEGFVNATLLFCIGSPEILMTKGTMDGIISILFAGSFGVGALFSIIPMSICQGALTFIGLWAEPFITQDMYANISGVGGLMIMGIGLNMLKITKLNLGDMLPGLIYVVFLTLLF